MMRFGHSAFLKLSNLNPRPQRTAIRGRLVPSERAFDFHRSLRLRCSSLILGEKPVGEIVASVAEIKRLPERKSVTAGLKQLIAWRRSFEGKVFKAENRVFESPNGVFSVRFDPVFGIEIEDRRIAVHLWNTMKPDLDPRMVHATLMLFSKEGGDKCDELGLLSLRDGRFYRTDDLRTDTPLRHLFVYHFERLIKDAEGSLQELPRPEDRPHPF